MRLSLFIASSWLFLGGCPGIDIVQVVPGTDAVADGATQDADGNNAEVGPDVTPEVLPDVTPEISPEVTQEVSPEVSEEVDGTIETVSGCAQDSDCDDSNPCTADACANTVCSNTILTGATCDDGSACSTSDSCDSNGVCKGTAVVCDDGNDCTSDGCDPSTGQCVASVVPDGQGCAFPLGCDGVCTVGACGCGCSGDLDLLLTLGSNDGALPQGEFYLNKSGTATTLDNEPLSSAGPLYCPDQWLAGGEWLPQLEAYPLEIEWRRPCTQADSYSDAANQYQAAGGTYWDAQEANLLKQATFKAIDSSGAEVASLTIGDFHVVSVGPAFDDCDEVQVVQIRGNKSPSKHFSAEVEGIGSFRVGAFGIDIGPTLVPLFSDPYAWNDSVMPSGGSSATVQLQSPCGTTGTDSVFGFGPLAQWAAGGQTNASVIFHGVHGIEIKRVNLFDASITTLGACEDGKRTVTIAVGLAQKS